MKLSIILKSTAAVAILFSLSSCVKRTAVAEMNTADEATEHRSNCTCCTLDTTALPAEWSAIMDPVETEEVLTEEGPNEPLASVALETEDE